jgi:hypothetical protein
MLAKVDGHLERLMARMDSQLEKMEACLEKMEATDLGANPEEKQTVAKYPEAPKEEAAVGQISSCKATPAAEETDPGRCWVPAEVGL